jgi:hypothetical protein
LPVIFNPFAEVKVFPFSTLSIVASPRLDAETLIENPFLNKKGDAILQPKTRYPSLFIYTLEASTATVE